MNKIILTADRPTGKLHLGHYVGSLMRRVQLQNEGAYDDFYIMVADSQALTDNYGNVQKVRDNNLNVVLDYLAVGIDPNKVTIFVQSQISELTEFTFYYMNLVTLSRLQRNPTVKSEIKLRGFEKSIPMGFLTYPVSQTADITAFNATIIPVGDEQLPMIEQAREIVRSFNNLYGETLIEPSAVLPEADCWRRLVGIDGGAKMSKSLGNCIYLSDDSKTIHNQVFNMYTDPNHIHVEDPGQVEGKTVFTYLDVFDPDKDTVAQLKEDYQKGGLGDVKIKRYLNKVLEAELAPIRERRQKYAENLDAVYDMLYQGSQKANQVADQTLQEVRDAIGFNYFKNRG